MASSLELFVRVERVDPFTIVLVCEAGEAVMISNGEFLQMMYTIQAGHWDAVRRDAEAHRAQEVGRLKGGG